MANFTDQSKNSSSFTGQPYGSAGLTWADHTETWGQAQGSWANPFLPFTNQSKNSTSLTNQTKN